METQALNLSIVMQMQVDLPELVDTLVYIVMLTMAMRDTLSQK